VIPAGLRKTYTILILLAVLALLPISSEGGERLAIHIEDMSKGVVGKLLVYEVEKLINQSSRFKIVKRKDNVPKFIITIITDTGDNMSTSYIATYTSLNKKEDKNWPIMLGFRGINICEASRIREVAAGVVESAETSIDYYLSQLMQ